MPLSEEELRLLEQMERALLQEDPKFASTLRGTNLRRAAQRRAILAGVVFVVGIGLLMTGVITQLPIVSVLGFVVMLGAATFGLAALRAKLPLAHDTAPHASHGFTVFDGGRTSRVKRQKRSGTFMQRMELRWEKRRRDF
ncbi:DUF3040 domain-containing protein [Nocardioides sp. Kera G14]|uniref:DUF3040 domain-containing protein n=1 Tax=Nocardioides sp. Kera G14 TaxID=2884264 RepID=UPI001D128C73|nr:DUF3040 domain-containing protein [Nocardioides sp. Kera G14]UDY22499.1 DUF3040 domain-containing protein [Nocardioides sp. Kera G14]